MTTSERAWISLCQITTCENWGVQAISVHIKDNTCQILNLRWWASVLRSRISLSLYLVLRPLFIDATTKSLWVIRWKRTTLNESDVFLFFIHFWARIRSPSFLPLAKTLAVALVIPTCDLKVGSTVLIRQETITKDP